MARSGFFHLAFRNDIIKGAKISALLRQMQKSGTPEAEHNSCMQYIGVLSRTWITRFEPKMCYNLQLNELFANSYPNLFAFVAGIQKFEFNYTMRSKKH
ncbi:hypothetical protein MXB_944 [Myxobolus squamalis]|nr:hypothetical protein MXB_944 [Myxobolus squamalis]